MLKSETLKMKDFNSSEIQKPVLLRYTVAVESNQSKPYDKDVLKLINSIKGIPELFKSVELHYEFVDTRIRPIKRQKILIKLNEKEFYTFSSEKDLDLFFYFMRLFKDYEPEVEVREELVLEERLLQIVS